jgi:hypothetical protein
MWLHILLLWLWGTTLFFWVIFMFSCNLYILLCKTYVFYVIYMVFYAIHMFFLCDTHVFLCATYVFLGDLYVFMWHICFLCKTYAFPKKEITHCWIDLNPQILDIKGSYVWVLYLGHKTKNTPTDLAVFFPNIGFFIHCQKALDSQTLNLKTAYA